MTLYSNLHKINDDMNPRQKEMVIKKFLRTRLSKNFILQDFMTGVSFIEGTLSGYPKDNHHKIIESGKVLAGVCEAIEKQFGRLTITYGYKTPEQAEEMQAGRDSDPHCWDKDTRFKGEIFARMDVMVYAVEDGECTKHDVALWLIQNTMVDLVMTFSSSNVLCITVCPRPRRVYKEWLAKGSKTHVGTDYWQCEYGTQADWLQAKGTPSCSGGNMNWWAKFKAIGY